MILIDDILLCPIHGIFWVVRKVHEAAQQELESEKDNITAQLSELYMRLETKQITEEEFDAQERALLDRLDQLDKRDGDMVGENEESSEGAGETQAEGAEDGEPEVEGDDVESDEDAESDEEVQDEDPRNDLET